MIEFDLSSEELVNAVLRLSETEEVAILDSCGSENLGSHLLIAGVGPIETAGFENQTVEKTLFDFDRFCSGGTAAIFTLSYDFGLKLLGLESRHPQSVEPDISVLVFENLVVHDYSDKTTRIIGNPQTGESIMSVLLDASRNPQPVPLPASGGRATSNFTRDGYIEAVEEIKEEIRRGNTYQTNLTQQFTVKLNESNSPQDVFRRLRNEHSAAFGAFVRRKADCVVSISPERFFHVTPVENGRRMIASSPIKGTIRRGVTAEEDAGLKERLAKSEKDRAENTMIVDLIRNDLGRVSEFGSVNVDSLCEIEQHPSLFHLVSTVSGQLRDDIRPSDILRAVFPCGSITGCPKLSTMRLIDRLENVSRGLSMGAIGYRGFDGTIDLSVAIRTMVTKNNTATFNVGGGVVIDSEPEAEYRESLLKAQALLRALGVREE